MNIATYSLHSLEILQIKYFKIVFYSQLCKQCTLSSHVSMWSHSFTSLWLSHFDFCIFWPQPFFKSVLQLLAIATYLVCFSWEFKVKRVVNFCINHFVIAPSIRLPSLNIKTLHGETVSFKCPPSNNTNELYWTYMTVDNDSDSVNNNNVSQSKFLSGSTSLDQLILPIATASDTGNYTCIVQGINNVISQTITLTVLPGKLLHKHMHIHYYVCILLIMIWL